jgi:outer membrane protein
MDKNNTSLDIVTGPQNGPTDAATIDHAADIKTRRIDYLAGLRLTHYYNDIIVQFEARKDISGTHDGEFYLFLTGQSWMLGNGTQHLLAGVAYQTASIVNYYLGVSPTEANALIPAYEADDAFIYKIEYGITYPLTPKWIVRTHLNIFQFDTAIVNSPLMANTNNNYFEASATFNYVF